MKNPLNVKNLAKINVKNEGALNVKKYLRVAMEYINSSIHSVTSTQLRGMRSPAGEQQLVPDQRTMAPESTTSLPIASLRERLSPTAKFGQMSLVLITAP